MHLTDTELNDYVDGLLSGSDAVRVAAHVRECQACALELEQITALADRLRQLPAAIAPERDLRPDIWRGIDEGAVIPIRDRARGPLWALRYRLAAAAVLLIIASSLFTLIIVSRGKGFDTALRDDYATTRLVRNDPVALERQYSDELRELELMLRKSRGALAPETIRIMEENLDIIDNAIREARAAIEADPNSEMLLDLLRSAYERKLELLRQAAKTSPVT